MLNNCTPLSQGKGTLNVGFDLVCNMSIELTVADDLSVSSSGAGQSCGTGQLSNVQLCVGKPMEQSWEAVPGWSFDSANGKIDDVSGIMDLSVTGNRIGLVRVTFMQAKTNDVHTNPLYSRRASPMSADNGSFRSFGSLTTHAGRRPRARTPSRSPRTNARSSRSRRTPAPIAAISKPNQNRYARSTSSVTEISTSASVSVRMPMS